MSPEAVLLKVGSIDYLHLIPMSIPNLQILGAELNECAFSKVPRSFIRILQSSKRSESSLASQCKI